MTESKNPCRSVKRQKNTDEAENYELPRWLYEKDGTVDKEMVAEFNAKRDDLIERISEAFADVRFKGDVTYVEGDLNSKEAINRAFRNRRWDEISLEDIAQYGWEIPWAFRSEALHYYLPAFMIGIMRYPDTTDRVQDALIISPDHLWRSKTVALFSPEQKQGIHDFYRFMKLLLDRDDRIEGHIKFWRAKI